MEVLFVDFMNLPAYDCDTPYTKGIGGTQSAICYYAEALAAKGYKVTVALCNLSEPKLSRGVQFQTIAWVNSGVKTDIVVWCSGVSKSVRQLFSTKIQANLKVAWIPHNVNEPAVDEMPNVLYDFDAFAFVSDWQRRKYIDTYGIESERTFLMLNGVSPGFIGDFDITAKKPKLIYLSQPDRGLSIVADAWSRIVEAHPDAEFHAYGSRRLYGGTDHSGTLAVFDRIRAMKNAFVEDPVGQTELVNVCRDAAIFAYPTDFYETGCITLTEACAGGCVPIVSELGVLGTYFNDCLPFDDGLVDAFVKRACQLLDLYKSDPTKFFARCERYAYHFQSERDYRLLADKFIKEVDNYLSLKQHAVTAFENAQTAFGNKNYRSARLHLDNMLPMFKNQSYVYNYFLWRGVCAFHENALRNAVVFFEKAYKWGNDIQLCINMILTHEKLNNGDEVIRWCENALKFKFNIQIIYKILNLVQKKPYFERCKWGKYLLSLWNDDIHSTDWMSLFLSHGNMVASDFTLVMRHEEGISNLANLIHRGLAFAKLNKQDLTKNIQMRSNLQKIFSNIFLNLNYCETRNPEHYRYIKYYMENIPKLSDIVLAKFNKISPGRKIRIGFLSGDLVYHPVSYILNGIVEHIDKSKFEVHIFSTTPVHKDNSLQNKIRKHADTFADMGEDADCLKIKDTIIEKDIDVLIEMTGHTSNGNKLIEALHYKPARVIANYFAYPNSYGIDTIDYKIGDKHVFPTGLENYYIEKFCKIEGGFHTYKPIVELSVNKKEHSGIMFGCTNNPKKYRPDWIKSVAKILKSVPGSKLKMRYFNLDDPSIQEFYWKEFEKHGVERSRIDLALGETLSKYFESYSDMDICLDPYPYNGGTINIEILYAGLPYVTKLGNSYVSRVGASILHQIGHPELIAKNDEEYVKLAVDLAKDAEKLAIYKNTIRSDMMRSTLGDNAAFTKQFEKGLLWMLNDKKWFA